MYHQRDLYNIYLKSRVQYLYPLLFQTFAAYSLPFRPSPECRPASQPRDACLRPYSHQKQEKTQGGKGTRITTVTSKYMTIAAERIKVRVGVSSTVEKEASYRTAMEVPSREGTPKIHRTVQKGIPLYV